MKQIKKIAGRSLILVLLFVLLMPGTKAMAASKKKKAMKAYAKYLAKHIGQDVSDRQYYDASFCPANTDYVNCFFLHDINNDKVPELFALTKVNFRWFNIRIFTYKSGKVKLYKIKGSGDAFFCDRATAAGAYDFYICKKKHIHNIWSGSTPIGFASYEKIYKRSGSKLKEYLSKNEKSSGPTSTYFKYGKTITSAQYSELTKGCAIKTITYSANTKDNRSKLKKGKLKVQ